MENSIINLKHMFLDTETGQLGLYDECGQDLGYRFDTLEDCIKAFDEYVDYLNKEK